MKNTKRRLLRAMCVPLETGAVVPREFGPVADMVADVGGRYVTVDEQEIISRAFEILGRRVLAGPVLSAPRAVREYLRLRIGHLEHEVFGLVLLDNRNRVVALEILFTGTVDGATCHVREIVKTALKHNAAAALLFHNHPSQICEPSQADEMITRRVKDALGVVEIRVLDHLVISTGVCESMAERGMM